MPRVFVTLTAALLWVMISLPAHAATVIRDAEIEQALKQLAAPILNAAGVGVGRIRILVIRDNTLNAFVADSRHIFLTSSLIRQLKTPEALQAVLAHEVAHITGGHLTRRATNARIASRIMAISFALSAVAAATGNGEAGVGLAAGGASSAQRVFFAHTRAEEASADQSGLRYMSRAGIDPAAALEVLELFRGQEVLRPGRQDPYARTHPLTRDRLRAVRGYVAALKSKPTKRTAQTAYWYARMRAKLDGFLSKPSRTLRSGEAKGSGEIAVLRRAVAYHRMPKPKKALGELNTLLKLRPRDAFYHELRGQVLLESGNPAAAVQSYQNAANLARGEGLILGGLGRAYLAQNTRSANASALKVLIRARANDPGAPGLLRDLAVAHARNGQNGLASVATAERYLLIGSFKDAQLHSKRALGQLPRGSTGWLRADDVLRSAEQAERNQKRRR